MLPYARIKGPFADFAVMRAIRRRELPEKPMLPTVQHQLLWKLCHNCWVYDTTRRITAKEAVIFLGENESIQEKQTISSSALDKSEKDVEDFVGKLSTNTYHQFQLHLMITLRIYTG